MCKIWLESIPSATDLRMREKNTICVDLFIKHICLCLHFFVSATGHSFGAILTLNGSNDVISQPLLPFGGHINIASY